MNYKIFILALLLLQTFNLSAQEKPLDLYLLIGQSNMAGRGTVELQDTVTFPRVFTLNKNNEWVPVRDPIHFDKSVAGVGLGRTFGIEMTKANPDAVIGLIPCAVGGSSIDAWKPGSYFEQTKTYPWDDMEKRLKIAMKSGTVRGILWHQGESDSNPEKCYSYKEKLEDLIQRVRTLAGNPDVPFVAGEFGRFKIKSNKKQYSDIKPSPAEVVMQSTKAVVTSDKNAAFVKSNGLDHRGDNTHFNSKSYRIFGKRYAKAMLKLQRK
jgi:hypothetical protein